MKRSPKYILDDEKLIILLNNAFSRLYPLMSYEFEKTMLEQNRYLFKDILSDQPSGIEEYKNI